MPASPPTYRNIKGLESAIIFGRFFRCALGRLLDSGNRSKRRKNNVTPGDAFFNFVKLSFLENTMVKYRRMVKFGDRVVIDSTVPPFPSPAFDRRISNYINNINLTTSRQE